MSRPIALRLRYSLLFALASLIIAGSLLMGSLALRAAPPPLTPPDSVRFAVIGDYGKAGTPEGDVAALVHSWSPDFIVTVGDNSYYTVTSTQTITQAIDDNIGQYYHSDIYPYTGAYGQGAAYNRFWPAMGNHDWSGSSNPHPYVDYFTLPNNERYYDMTQGPVQFFMVDSDNREPDGNTMTSTQALWLQSRLAASTAAWKLVLLHHTPYSSIAATTALRWPYQQWGASAVLAGHIHCYERFDFSGFPYIVDGLGGDSITTANFNNPQPGSVVRYKGDYGAMLVEANASAITFQFFTRTGLLIDTYSLGTAAPSPTTTATATPTGTLTPAPLLVGHVTWQGPPAQPNTRQALPISMTLRLQSGGPATEYTGLSTDASGYFTVALGTLPLGTYNYRAKGPKYLATGGSVVLTGALLTNVEMGTQKAGDTNNDNVVNTADFTILKNSFGRSPGEPGYDPRADLNNDNTVNSADFNLLKGNFGQGGAPPISPQSKGK